MLQVRGQVPVPPISAKPKTQDRLAFCFSRTCITELLGCPPARASDGIAHSIVVLCILPTGDHRLLPPPVFSQERDKLGLETRHLSPLARTWSSAVGVLLGCQNTEGRILQDHVHLRHLSSSRLCRDIPRRVHVRQSPSQRDPSAVSSLALSIPRYYDTVRVSVRGGGFRLTCTVRKQGPSDRVSK